ncbi:MAG: glycoside hydrolase domain-containing protein [Armatimonadota bacterium]
MATAAEYDVRWAHSADEVFLDGRGERELPPEGLSLAGARGEYESLQVVVAPRDEGLRAVRVQFEDLASGDGDVLDAERLSWRQVGYLYCEEHEHYDSPGAGWYPDPLLEPESCDVAHGDHQPLWITVEIPRDQPPGEYRGMLRVLAENAEAVELPLTVTVWPVTIPAQSSIPTAFTVGLAEHEASWQEDKSTYFPGHQPGFEFRRMNYDFSLRYRISPDHLYLREPRPMADYEYLARHGASCFNLLCLPDFAGGPRREMPSDERVEAALDALEPYVRRMRELGAMDRAYVYGIDELGSDLMPAEQKWFKAVHDRYPDLRTVQTSNWVDPELECDIYCPLLSVYSPKRQAPYRERGTKFWWYVCIGPRHPYPNFFIEYPVIEARLIFWMTYMWRADGFLYYATNLWPHEDGPMPPGPRCEWDPRSWNNANGDGCLYYPGQHGPLATTRLENIRDGLEDYELLRLLDIEAQRHMDESGETASDRGGQLGALIAPSRREYSRNPDELAAVRRRAAEELMALQEGPALSITAPGRDWRTELPEYRIMGRAPAWATVTVNGEPANRREERFSHLARLNLGRNTFEVTATADRPDEWRQQKQVVIIREEPGYVPPPISADETSLGAVIDDFEDLEGWRIFGSGDPAKAIAMQSRRFEGRRAMVVSYNAEAAGDRRASVGRYIPKMGRERVGLHFWVYGDGSGAELVVELCEEDWPNWTHTMTVDFTGWREFNLTWQDFPGGNHEYSRNAKPDWDSIFWLALNPRGESTTFAISDLRFLVPRD